MPGWTVALDAGAQADAPDAVTASVTSEAAIAAASLRAFKVCLPQLRWGIPRLAPCLPRGAVFPAPAEGYASRPLPRRGRELVALGLDVVEQLVEGLGELLHALLLERRDDVVVVDPRLAQVVEDLLGVVDVALERVAPDLAVVLEVLDRLGRHRVDGVGPDQLLDVHRVLVRVVLDRRRRPQAALRLGALGR